MDSRWWELPGPGGFVRTVWEDLQGGKNVVLALPTTTPSGLRDALAVLVRQNDLWAWRDFPASVARTGVPDLVERLHAQFAPPSRAGAVLSPTTLSEDPRLADTVIWVGEMTLEDWPTWDSFLCQYQHACRSRLEQGRGLFCVPLLGTVARSTPAPDVTLSIRHWRGVVRPLDLLIDLSPIADGLPGPLWHRRLAVAAACELAGSDAVLARQLIQLDLPNLLEPFDFLRTVAHSRAGDETRVRQPAWEDGLLDGVGKGEIFHSAVLVMRGCREEVYHRIWRAEVGILYPFLEEQRVLMLPSLRRYLRLPLETDAGRVNDIHDLELGQLLHFLCGRNLPRALWRRLSLLTEMRHALAHLRPVSTAALFADELLRDL